MTAFELIVSGVDAVKESLSQKSDVYNGKRVIIKMQKWLGTINVWVKGNAAIEFPIDTDTIVIANYINDTTQEN
jgi:hypothetical protein